MTIIWICPTHSMDIIPTRDTTEYWDSDAQEWILNGDFDPPYCPECGEILTNEVTP